MLLPNRHGSVDSDSYRYGFNDMERDDEIKGSGNSYDFGNRFYDSRVFRFLSIDPLYKDIPFESNYAFAGNSPIENIDYQGLHKYPKGKKGDEQRRKYPLVTKYLSTMLAQDVKRSSRIKNAYVLISKPSTSQNFPNNDAILNVQQVEEMFQWGNGPIIEFSDEPGGIISANGKYYDPSNSHVKEGTIQINERLIQFVEDKLKDDDASNDKYALFLLSKIVLHETGHHVDYKDGLRNSPSENRKAFGHGEIGTTIESIIYYYNEIFNEAVNSGASSSPGVLDNPVGQYIEDADGNVVLSPDTMKNAKIIVDEINKNKKRAKSLPSTGSVPEPKKDEEKK